MEYKKQIEVNSCLNYQNQQAGLTINYVELRLDTKNPVCRILYIYIAATEKNSYWRCWEV